MVPAPVGTVPGGTSTTLETSIGVESASNPATATTDPLTTTPTATTVEAMATTTPTATTVEVTATTTVPPTATTVEVTATPTVPPTATTVPPARILRSPTALEPLRVMVLGLSLIHI